MVVGQVPLLPLSVANGVQPDVRCAHQQETDLFFFPHHLRVFL